MSLTPPLSRGGVFGLFRISFRRKDRSAASLQAVAERIVWKSGRKQASPILIRISIPMRSSIDAKAGSVSFSVDTGIYPKEVVYKACYSFIDRMYIFLDTAKRKGVITVTIKGKTPLRKKALETLEGEFMNELLNSLVREKVSKRNRKVLEEIVAGAMGAALGVREMEGGDRRGNDVGSDGKIDDAEAKEIEAAVEALKSELAAIESIDAVPTKRKPVAKKAVKSTIKKHGNGTRNKR